VRSTGTTPSVTRRHAPHRLILSVTAVFLVLAGCAQGGPAAEPDSTPQESTVQSIPESSETPSPTVPPTSTPAASGISGTLTVSIAQDTSTEPVQYTLECVDGVPGPATTLPNADAACAALARLGAKFFTAKPNKDVICTQQYGGPQTASITGELDGSPIRASFALTDGCQISRWKQVSDILGAPGAQ
jgi:hypothetical protein